jgi:hypothetical protein
MREGGLYHGWLQVLMTTSTVCVVKDQISGQAASRIVKKGFKDLNHLYKQVYSAE